VYVKSIVYAGVAGRGNEGLFVHVESDMANHALVENFKDLIAIVDAAFGKTLQVSPCSLGEIHGGIVKAKG